MIERLLIANRGEIARRIIRTCRRLGVETAAVFSDADADAAFVAEADWSVGISAAPGANTPAESYLRVDAVVAAARSTGADAVHPGYGFLAENEEFASAVTDAGLIFVGPTPRVIAAMGSKLESKRLMAEAGVPLLPSTEVTGLTGGELSAAVGDVGYPLLIKASAGGGGRGMRIVEEPSGLTSAVDGAAREAESAFGDGTIYAERYVAPSRHVEVQIFGDMDGRVVHFGERECSIQRRHQKIIEESPSASLDDAGRSALHSAAVLAGQSIGYTGAGTVEFLLGPAGDFYFLEVNTRLQVEHPVTEAVYGVDLVELQLEVAAGGPVPQQSEIGSPRGHAMEARLYAEDPTDDYRPSTGEVRAFVVPGHSDGEVRVDAAFGVDGGIVTQFYDPMVAKVVTHGPNRTVAARRLAATLAGTVVDGIATNRELLVRTLRHPEFIGDQGDSNFLVRNDPKELGRPLLDGPELAAAAAAAALAVQFDHRGFDRHTAAVSSGFRNVVTAPQRVSLSLGGVVIDVDYRFERGRLVHLAVDGVTLDKAHLFLLDRDVADLSIGNVRRRFGTKIRRQSVAVSGPAGSAVFEILPRFSPPGVTVAPGATVASMPGTIVAVAVAVGDEVTPGDLLVVMEAMKMELAIKSTASGVVSAVSVSAGDTVEAGAVLVETDDGAQ